MLDWSNAQNNFPTIDRQKDLCHKPNRVLEDSLPDAAATLTEQLTTTQIKQFYRHIATGDYFRKGLNLQKRCKWLSRMEKLFAAHARQFDLSEAPYLKNIYQLRVAIQNALRIERRSQGHHWLAEFLRIESIQSIREAYWLNRYYRQGNRLQDLNLWKREDRLEALGRILNQRLSQPRKINKSQTRTLMGSVKRLALRAGTKWQDISVKATSVLEQLIHSLYRHLFVDTRRTDVRNQNISGRATVNPTKIRDDQARPYHFERLPGAIKDSLSGLAAWPVTDGEKPHIAEKKGLFPDPDNPLRKTHQRFKNQMIAHLQRRFDLSSQDCQRLKTFLEFMLPLCQGAHGADDIGNIQQRVKFALQKDPQMTEKLVRAGNTSFESLLESFTLKLGSFYNQARLHFSY